ncbi:dTDP-4-dehydrorhamnose reductase [Pseudoalteromonas piratica]|uniref:dTDP-4-dehydrorhamnose reductase n=1 Tax=Pseudoalteromonas piratica TaxID=1348114 RepID=A0A0A7EH97_9GAMM|nr:dTDP-4-dehydrorhamnose reductase [Pseudoalteromonas piratica]AIY65436.1 dTDP-4-dehydrorhamnose reductase [Pseudoalteromonas piratica]
MKALVIGKSGQVAYELLATCPAHISAVAYGRSDIDILDITSVQAVVEKEQPDVIINASAYTAVDKAETDKDAAFAINGDAVANLANVAKQQKIRLLHISTDFVFDGTQSTPYKVDDRPNPINMYGASKLAGELAIQEIYPENAAIVRTSWVYSSHGNNFVKTMLRLMAEKDALNVVSDQIGSPTYAKGLAEYLWRLAEQDTLELIQHYSDLGVASWYDFAVAIQEIALGKGLLTKSIPISTIPASQYPTPAKRPAFSLMDKHNMAIGVHWRKQLSVMLRMLINEQ